jgi:hypothetical protein
MGLDSVALLVDVEKHFDISISNAEAEKIYTVQDFADCVFTKVTIHTSQKCKSQILFYRFRSFFVETWGIEKERITPDRKLNELIRVNELIKGWAEIEISLGLKLPELSKLDFDPTLEKEIKFLGLKFWTRKAAVTNGTVKDLVNWTLSLNPKELIDAKNLCSKIDIERIVMGIISESCGIPINEIKLEHSITNDLGID